MMNFVHGIRMEQNGSGTSQNGAEETSPKGAEETGRREQRETVRNGATARLPSPSGGFRNEHPMKRPMTPTPLCGTDSGRRSPDGSASPCAPSAAAGCPIRRRSHPAPKGWTRKGASACLTLSRLLLACLALTAASCQVSYHPYDTRVEGECGINAKNIARIEAATAGRDAIRFAVISDTQRWYDETEDAVQALNNRDDIDFVLHAGDMSDFGMKVEFERQRDILNRLRVPYVVLLGNHDCLATGEEIFQKVFGAFNFAFTAGDIRFICLNTNALEFDLREPVPNFEFLESELADFPAEATRTIVTMHARPYTEQFDNNVARVFQFVIREFPRLLCCINGHGHSYNVTELFDDGVLYYECDNIHKRSYLLFTVNSEGYECTRVEF